MANQIKLTANINPANTAVEVSTDNGATYRAVAMPTVGSQQEGILTSVAAGTYAPGTVKMRAVAFPSVVVSNTIALTVADATAGSMTIDDTNNAATFTPASGTSADYGYEILP